MSIAVGRTRASHAQKLVIKTVKRHSILETYVFPPFDLLSIARSVSIFIGKRGMIPIRKNVILVALFHKWSLEQA